MTPTKEQILDALRHVRYPGKEQDIVALGMVSREIRIEGNSVSLALHFPRPKDPFAKSLIRAAETALLTYVHPDLDVKGHIQALFPEPQPKATELLPGVKNVIAVFSGKGGVGKSTITANLAVALAQTGYSVGLLDADVYGPSMPKMFGCEGYTPQAVEAEGAQKILPAQVYGGIKLLSVGFFVPADKALLWRGTLASNALTQLLRDGDWGQLDFLLLDMPPGTGDIHLTLVQNLAVTGAIVVTTPQQVALADAVKGINLFQTPEVNVPVLGLVENMSWFTPAELPDNRYYLFGKGGGVDLADRLGVPLLAQVPLVQSVCESGDEGNPIATRTEHILNGVFADLATRVVQAVERRNEQLPASHKVQTEH